MGHMECIAEKWCFEWAFQRQLKPQDKIRTLSLWSPKDKTKEENPSRSSFMSTGSDTKRRARNAATNDVERKAACDVVKGNTKRLQASPNNNATPKEFGTSSGESERSKFCRSCKLLNSSSSDRYCHEAKKSKQESLEVSNHIKSRYRTVMDYRTYCFDDKQHFHYKKVPENVAKWATSLQV